MMTLNTVIRPALVFRAFCSCQKWRGVPLRMHRMNPEYLDPDTLNRYAVLLRQEPDQEDDEEEEEYDDGEDDDNAHNDDGYSE